MTTFERIKFLAENQKKSLNKVEEDLGYGKNVLYRLKNTSPSAERLQELADYFNVSTDYLLGRTDNPDPTSFGQELDWNDTLMIDGSNIEEPTSEYFAIQRKSKKLNQKDQQRLLKIMEATFDDIENGTFEEDEDDDL